MLFLYFVKYYRNRIGWRGLYLPEQGQGHVGISRVQ